MDKVLQKEIAVSCLEKLDIYKPYIRKFKSKAGIPCFFEGFAGFYADQEPELWQKIKEVEEEFGCLVYAITHDLVADLGELWSMLCVPKECDGVEDLIGSFNNPNRNEHYVFTYTWNKTMPMFSEFGDIAVRSFGGGLKRIY
jgi:hypothetical protein